MDISRDFPESRSRTTPRAIAAPIRRRYGYPAPLRGRTDDLADEVAALRAEVEQLRAAVYAAPAVDGEQL